MEGFFSIEDIKNLITLSPQLDQEAFRTPLVHHQLNVILLELKNKLNKDQKKQKQLLRTKWEYYTGKSPPEVYKEKPFALKILKGDLHLYLESDEELSTLNRKVEELKNGITFIEESMKQINQRNFLIKSILDYRKFMAGEY